MEDPEAITRSMTYQNGACSATCLVAVQLEEVNSRLAQLEETLSEGRWSARVVEVMNDHQAEHPVRPAHSGGGDGGSDRASLGQDDEVDRSVPGGDLGSKHHHVRPSVSVDRNWLRPVVHSLERADM